MSQGSEKCRPVVQDKQILLLGKFISTMGKGTSRLPTKSLKEQTKFV